MSTIVPMSYGPYHHESYKTMLQVVASCNVKSSFSIF